MPAFTRRAPVWLLCKGVFLPPLCTYFQDTRELVMLLVVVRRQDGIDCSTVQGRLPGWRTGNPGKMGFRGRARRQASPVSAQRGKYKLTQRIFQHPGCIINGTIVLAHVKIPERRDIPKGELFHCLRVLACLLRPPARARPATHLASCCASCSMRL